MISVELGVNFVQELCSGSEVTKNLLKAYEIWVVLNGNPHSRKKVEEGDYCLRTNPNGVDLNRNWSQYWNKVISIFLFDI